MDLLTDMFVRQLGLQLALGVKFDQTYINTMALAMHGEIDEALRETPWKPWKKQQEFNREKYVEELSDVMHFYINMCLAHKITADEIYNAFITKNAENRSRKERGY